MAVSKMKAHRSEQPHPKTAGILYFLNVTLLSPCIGAPGDMFANARSLPIRQKPPPNLGLQFSRQSPRWFTRDALNFIHLKNTTPRCFMNECRQKACSVVCHAAFIAKSLDELLVDHKKMKEADEELAGKIKTVDAALFRQRLHAAV
jgi:hypothetical protein